MSFEPPMNGYPSQTECNNMIDSAMGENILIPMVLKIKGELAHLPEDICESLLSQIKVWRLGTLDISTHINSIVSTYTPAQILGVMLRDTALHRHLLGAEGPTCVSPVNLGGFCEVKRFTNSIVMYFDIPEGKERYYRILGLQQVDGRPAIRLIDGPEHIEEFIQGALAITKVYCNIVRKLYLCNHCKTYFPTFQNT